MPRVNRATSERTKEKIIETALDIVINQGYEELTFSNIAEAAKISRSSTNTHFKRKEDLEEVLKPLLGQIMAPFFCYDSAEEFLKSWRKVIDENEYAQQVMFNSGKLISSREGITGLIGLIQGEDRQKVEDTVLYCIGYAELYGRYARDKK